MKNFKKNNTIVLSPRRRGSSSNSGGFTLIELLVVIAIIGMLAATVLTSLGTARSKGRDARRISDIANIRIALELYFDDNRGYPDHIYGDMPLSAYISKMPTDPSGGNYSYNSFTRQVPPGTKPTKYHLGAVLENASPVLEEDLNLPVAFSLYVVKPGGEPASGFHGNSDDCLAAIGLTSPAVGKCYDIGS